MQLLVFFGWLPACYIRLLWGFLKCGCMLHFCAAARMFWVVTRVLLCSYYDVLDGCRGVAMQLLRCSELLLLAY